MPIPDSIKSGIDQLKAAGVCDARGDLKQHGYGIYTLRCGFKLPQSNSAGLPPELELELDFTKDYPLGSIDVRPVDGSDEPYGFPHQDAESGKLCLPFKDDAPYDESRLAVVARWAEQWLNDAASGKLLAPGDPYELPDFSRKRVQSPLLDLRFALLIDESNSTYESWASRVGQWGTVKLQSRNGSREMLASTFLALDGGVIRECEFGTQGNTAGSSFLTATWALLPDVLACRHRPAQTYGELREVFQRAGVSLKSVLKNAWQNGGSRVSVVLVGFPIPKNVGEHPSEVHWQPIVLPAPGLSKAAIPRQQRKRVGGGNLWAYEWKDGSFRNNAPVIWAKTENVASNRQFVRGSHPDRVRNEGVSIVGCGALGAPLAESFARGGISQIDLFDGQSIEYGNLCRHTLDGRFVGVNKAVSLAHRLQSCHPTSQIRGHACNVPFLAIDRQDRFSMRALKASSTIIDCSTDEGAFQWLSRLARSKGNRLASLFINANATALTLVLSGKQTAGAKVYRRLLDDIEGSRTCINPHAYFKDLAAEESVLPTGCWQPTFPGLNSHIWLLAYAAIEHLSAWMGERWGCDGYGILVRRNAHSKRGSIVETVWNEPYR